MLEPAVDAVLLERFRADVKSLVPHAVDGGLVENATPLVDITAPLLACAKEMGLSMGAEGVKVYAKMDSKILGGSVKVRPAVSIVEDAVASGKLRRGQVVFEATSGNFGLALGMLRKLDLEAVALVSRKLQKGVIDRLRADGVKVVDLDIDICPAPGLTGDADLLMAKAVAQGVRQQLAELGLETRPFDAARADVERALARQDAMLLAKVLAGAYGGFCPEQYDNGLNVEAHEEVTGPEIDQQLKSAGSSLAEYTLVCSFGTGGTATGVSAFVKKNHGRKGVRVVYPHSGQDVAGIRTKEKASGLKFYRPDEYLGEHEVDFEETRKVFDYFNRSGYDVGESGALVLFACIQMLNFGLERKLVAMVADGASKYSSVTKAPGPRKEQVSLKEASSTIGEYSGVVWAHNMFVPREEGLKVIAESLGCPVDSVHVAKAREVQELLSGREPSPELQKVLPADGRPLLVVCMAGYTSLALAKVLGKRGINAQSLMGGISGMPASRSRQPSELLQISRE